MNTKLFFLVCILFLSWNAQSQDKKFPSDTAMYQKHMDDGKALLAHRNYEAAKFKFSQASELYKNAPEPKEKIQEIEKILAVEFKVNTLIKEGDALFAEGKLEEARKKYEMVLVFKMKDTYSMDKIVEIDHLLHQK